MHLEMLQPRRHAYGLTVMEIRLPEQHCLLFPDPGLTGPAGHGDIFFRHIFDRPLDLTGIDRSDEVRSRDLTFDDLDTDADPELVAYQLRRSKEIEAQRGYFADWERYYMSVTGLRCRHCNSLFEDGEHAFWCPA